MVSVGGGVACEERGALCISDKLVVLLRARAGSRCGSESLLSGTESLLSDRAPTNAET